MLFSKKIKKTVHVEGMSCQHCVAHVKSALESIDGVSNAKVDLDSKTAVIKSSAEISDSDIRKVVDEAGYKVTEIE
ncbi:Cu2+-exporting ATPase [Clostridium algifaecis]|uniref:Cu2+-exporting ATPase n=1 Tax=Clostridium algifaecis TaxID=1472040 RepID=A0ABS4KMW2_9CLOT|nr:heavy metal-associated domain-containing protein [Clostridium algifaecis]MBP2031360.1 Cu2+-exporting ATPase [Clostridium algifaecis]